MKKTLVIVGIVVLLIVSLLGYGFYWAFYDIQHIKGQEILQKVSSPDGTYTITAYLNNGGATTAYAVLCSVKNNGTGKERNIYWQYRDFDANIIWLNEETVQIDGVELDVNKDTYDFRRFNR